MPMLTDDANEQTRKDREAKAAQAEPTKPVAEKLKGKGKGKTEPEPVTVK